MTLLSKYNMEKKLPLKGNVGTWYLFYKNGFKPSFTFIDVYNVKSKGNKCNITVTLNKYDNLTSNFIDTSSSFFVLRNELLKIDSAARDYFYSQDSSSININAWEKAVEALNTIVPSHPVIYRSQFYLSYLDNDNKKMLHYSKYIQDEYFVKCYYNADWSAGFEVN